MNKKQATFISGIICSKGLDLKRYINGNRLQEWTVIDLGLDLAANESRNPAKQQPTADLQRSASQPTRKDCPGCSWPRVMVRNHKQPVYNQNLPG